MLFMCWLCTYFNFFDLVGLPSILNGVLFFAELQQWQRKGCDCKSDYFSIQISLSNKSMISVIHKL